MQPWMAEKLVSLHLLVLLLSQIGLLLMVSRWLPVVHSDKDEIIWAGVDPTRPDRSYWTSEPLTTRVTVMSAQSRIGSKMH